MTYYVISLEFILSVFNFRKTHSRVGNIDANVNMSGLLTNIHETAGTVKESGRTYLVCGNYEYYHYFCDGFDDRVRF